MMPEAGHIDYGCLHMQHNVAADVCVLLLCTDVPVSLAMRCSMIRKPLLLRIGDTIRELYGTKIAKYETKKLSQKDVAKALEMSNRTLSDYVCGKINIKLCIFVKIAKFFGFDVEMILIPDGEITAKDKYDQCVAINAILLDCPINVAKRILCSFGVEEID